MEMIKECIYCKKEKYIWEFRADKNNTTWVKDYCKDCRKNSEELLSFIRFKSNIKAAIRNSFKTKGFSKNSRTREILGCSSEEFKIHIEKQFQSWMTWNNHGIYTGEINEHWQLDHIIPLSSAETLEDAVRLNHYTNLQPLCSYTNQVVKRDRILHA